MSGRAVHLTCAEDVESRPVKWLWPGYVPLGKITVIAGAPGLGKSLLTLMLASMVTRAGADVLLLSGEDDPADTIKPRLEAAQANEARVFLVDARECTDNGLIVPSVVQLPGDAYSIGAYVKTLDAKLVIVDPVAAFLDGDHSAYREQEVRGALAPLKQVAEDYRCAVVLVMHLNKGEGADPLRRIANSGAFTALARSVLVFGADPEDPEGDRGSRRILTVAKGNLRGAGRGSLQFEIRNDPPGGIDLESGIEYPRLVMLGESNVSAEDLLGNADERGAKGEAMTFLRDLLKDGPMSASSVKDAADAEGVSERTLKRAKSALGVRSVKDGLGAWQWHLPMAPGPLGPLPDTEVASIGPLPKGVGILAKGANGANGHTREGDNVVQAILDAFPGSSEVES